MRYLHFFLILVFCSLTLLFQSCSDNDSSQTLTTDETATDATARFAGIAPPLQNLDVPFKTYPVKTREAQTLRLESGTTIDIPAAAFVDAEGRPVEGQVDLQFREFHNAAELMACGIPMKVLGENGAEEWMQTAGMYEIQGSSNGQPVFIAPGKSLDVNLVSQVGGEYDFWKFDAEKGNWDNLGVSTPTPNPNADIATDEIANLERQAGSKPAPPVAFDPAKPKLDLEVNYQKFPELKDRHGIIWQLQENKKDIAWVFETDWDEVDLQPTGHANLYQLTLSNSTKTFTTKVAASLPEKDFTKAQAEYQKRLKEYQSRLLDLDEKRAYQSAQAEFVRSFQIEGFGIYNYDILMKGGGSIPILANFDFGEEVPKNLRSSVSVFLISGSGRMVVKFPPGDWKKFRFNPNLDNRLVAVLPGNRIATFSQADFKANLKALENASGQEYIFKMKLDEKPVESLAEVQQRIQDLAL